MFYFTGLKQKLQLMAEMKAMVDNFNEKMHAIKANMTWRHQKERKQLLKNYKQWSNRKYLSTVEITAQELEYSYFNSQPSFPEADC